ncbi:glycosyltransferase [Candidatus Parabeggiatoa sp. HSG14]|uniref:glycosyltransferase n=1 Tax=Candidatus Parabeggiatoa sp. HSG14 TaxID=3055593 RepID=UPI0025A80533|nr:glycosyltransferase [Thiotrichales bacterium HSG14]
MQQKSSHEISPTAQSIAIIVRTKDRPHLLTRCLQSLAEQKRIPNEVIVVNDGGVTIDEVVNNFADLNIQLIHNKDNQGRARAGNQGVQTAKSDVIGFLDDDDRFLSDHLQRLEKSMLHFDAKVAYSGCRLHKRDMLGDEVILQEKAIGQFNDSYDAIRLHYENYIPLINLLIDRALWLEVGGFDESFDIFEDWDVLLRLSTHTSFYHVNRITTEYAVWGATQSTQRTDQAHWREAYQQFFEKHLIPLPVSEQLQYLAEYWRLSQERRNTVQDTTQEKQALQLELTQNSQKLEQLQHQIANTETQSSQLQSDWITKYQQLQSDYARLQSDWITKYQQLQSETAQQISQSQSAYTQQEKHFKQQQAEMLKTITKQEKQYKKLQTAAKQEYQQYQSLHNTLHELSKQIAVGMTTENIGKTLQSRPTAYALAISTGGVIDDYYRLVNWIRDKANNADLDLSAVKKREDHGEQNEIPSPQSLSDVYPTFMSIAGNTENPSFMEEVNEAGTMPFMLGPGAVLVFTVYCTLNDFFRVDILLGTCLRINTCQVRVIIRDFNTKTPLRVFYTEALEIFDNHFHPFGFEPLIDSAGKTYQIEIDSPDASPQSAVAVWCHPKKPQSHYSQQWTEAEVQRSPQMLPHWVQQSLLDFPLSAQLSVKPAIHTFMVYGITESTSFLNVHVFLGRLSHALKQAETSGQVIVCGQVNRELRQYCQQHQLTILDDTKNHLELTAILSNWHKIQEQQTEYLWCCELEAMPQIDIVERVIEMFASNAKASLLIPMEKHVDGTIRAGYASLMRDGFLQTTAAGAPADHPYYGYRRTIEAASSLLMIIKTACLPSLDMDEISVYRTAMYQVSELIWQLKAQQYETLYEAALCYEHDKPYPEFTEQDYNHDNHYFYQRWNNKLPTHVAPFTHLGDLLNPLGQPTVLIIDATLPTYDEDSGSLRLYTLLKIWVSLGYRITFFPDNLDSQFQYRHALEALGIEVFHSDYGIQDVMAYRQFDFAFICRVDIGHRYIPHVRLLSPNTIIFYDTVDIHYIREQRQAEIENNPKLAEHAQTTKRKELSNCILANRVITVTEDDGYHLQKELPNLTFSVLPNIHQQQPLPDTGFEQRDGLVFIGNYNHLPNEDAMYSFIEEVLPKIHARLPDVCLYLIGSNMKDKMKALANEHVKVIGWVDHVEPEFAKRRVFVSYLRYGAGMKGKLGQALSVGLPIVTTTIGAEGMGLKEGETALIADQPDSFAEAVCRLYEDSLLWEKLSHQGKAYIEKNYGDSAVRNKLRDLLEE